MAQKLLTKGCIFLILWQISICSFEIKTPGLDGVPKPSLDDVSQLNLKNLPDSNAISTNLTNTIGNLLPSEQRSFLDRIFKDGPPVPQSDPEAALKVSEIVDRHGHTLQSLDVQTDDGYIITVQRIPYGVKGKGSKPRQPVLIQHGIFCSSAIWVLNTPDKNLAYILADAGYDVWLGNVRGTSYGRRHIKYSTTEDIFWNFSFDEMAKYDTPKIIDTMLKVTNFSQIFYIGHSMGTTIAFSLLSTQPKYNKIIKAVLALAPVALLKNARGIGQVTFSLIHQLSWLFDLLKTPIVAAQDNALQFTQNVCSQQSKLCGSLLLLLCGINLQQFNETRAPVFFRHTPELTSMQNFIHYSQLHHSEDMLWFDYGAKINLEKYGQEKPPAYALQNITTPVALLWSDNDLLADPRDVLWLSKKLSPTTLILNYHVDLPSFSHLDFMWAKDSKKLVYDKVLEVMKERSEITT